MGVEIKLYMDWVMSEKIGEVLGKMIGDMKKYGLEMEIKEVFIVIIEGMWKGLEEERKWLVRIVEEEEKNVLVKGELYVESGEI